MKKNIIRQRHPISCSLDDRKAIIRRHQVSAEAQALMDNIEDLLDFMVNHFPEDQANLDVLSQMYDDLGFLAREYDK